MLPLRFGVVALALVLLYCGAILLRAFYQTPAPPSVRHARAVTDKDVDNAKRLLCRLARSERAFQAATGHYADDFELRANGDAYLPPNPAIPYFYSVHIPVPERFVIVATAHGALQQHPPALLVDDRLQLCTVHSVLPDTSWRSDHLPERLGRVNYECEACD